MYLVFCLTVDRWKTIACAGCVSGTHGHCAVARRLGATIVCVFVCVRACVCLRVCVCMCRCVCLRVSVFYLLKENEKGR